MTEQISQRELRNDSGRIMKEVDAGRSFVVTRNSEPVGELRPLRRRRLVDASAAIEMFRGAPRVDRVQFQEDVDTVIDQSLDLRG